MGTIAWLNPRVRVAAASTLLVAGAWLGWRWTRLGPAGVETPRSTHAESSVAPASGKMVAANPQPATPPLHVETADEMALRAVFPPSDLPEIVTAPGARISLGYLAQNGADLSQPMPSKHRILTANHAVSTQWIAWAQAHDFAVRGPNLFRTHTGEARESLELVREEVPVPENLEREGRLVLSAVQQIPGSFYQTWSGEIVR